MAENNKDAHKKSDNKNSKDASVAAAIATKDTVAPQTPTQQSQVPSSTVPTPTEEKKPEAKEQKQKIQRVKKEEAVARGVSLPISKKHAMYLSTFIKNKSVDVALADLEKVLKFKKAVPFKGEIPHRHGDMMSGRYPINATKAFISVLKGLRGNILANGLDLETTKIVWASASWASRPHRKDGARFKRTNLVLKAKEVSVSEKKQEAKK